ncbi:uncharacterized protein LOC110982593 [Acanthaster planci]|uniref:Uncharacterized protein LOC110982593 n=1 Tax=Acanthaster planci TaxID=133434 RepID=A0A8B7YU42_ACAPL|nr:uncharacterized protein LOC110982593 [Acanthaster planci]
MGSLNYCDGYQLIGWRDYYYIMASATRASDMIESFGCHLSWTELRPVVADRQALSREEGILVKEQWDFDDRPTYYTAIRNLQGFIAYHLNKHDQALAFFQDVLDKDENNINGLGNMAVLHEKLYEIDEVKRYREKLQSVLERPSYEERARAYADKAHAIRYFEQFKRCFRYMRFIERAATIGRKCDGPQRAEWFFDYALALYRRDVQMLYLRKLAREADCAPEHSECYSDERIWEGFLKACKFFLEVARTSTSRDYQALSWVFLGILVNHDPENRSIAMAFPDEPEIQHLTAADCFERGVGMHPEHDIVTRRVGSEYVKLGRFAEAKFWLDKSLNILPSQFAYRHRGSMFLRMYEAADEEEKRTEDAKQWLREAVKDFNKALEMKEIHADYSDLGYAYFLLGETNKALVKFERATSSEQDDYFDPVLTHQRWAQCLEEKRQREGSELQLEEARRVREKILETPLEEDQLDYFSDDFDHYSTKEKPGFVRILQDYHFWAAHSKRRTSELNPPESQDPAYPRNTRYRYDFFVWHAERDSRWTVAFVHKLESEHGLVGSIQRRDFEVGRDVSSDVIRCLRQSYRFVIVLTPRPSSAASSGWESFAINQAVMEGGRRGGEYIVPIKLRESAVPDVLQTLTVRECEEGQILKQHWDELVRKLTQG